MWLGLGLGTSLLGGCGMQKSRADAEKIVARHFDKVRDRAYDGALADYDDEFFSVVSRDEWARRLGQVEAKLGPFQSYTVAEWNVNSKFGTGAGGTYVTLTCNVAYANYTAVEQMVLYRAKSDDDFKILRHGINSEGLFKE
jgi:hypothetical protein